MTTRLVTIPQDTLNYVDITAFNRFIDNVRRALKGNEECKTNLLNEDLEDMYRHGQIVWRAIQERLLP